MTKSAKIIAYYLPLSVLILGAALRINVYFQNRSLIIDEANLARYVIENKWTNFYQYQDKKLNYHNMRRLFFRASAKLTCAYWAITNTPLNYLQLLPEF